MKISVPTCLLAAALCVPAMAISRPDMESSAPSGNTGEPKPAASAPVLPAPQKNKPAELPEVWLGIVPMPMSPALVAQLDLNGNAGVLVHSVGPDSPAKKAGLQQYDVVLQVNGTPIRCPKDIAKSISGNKAGDKITVDIVRAGKKQNLEIALEKRPENMARVDGVMSDCDEFEKGASRAHKTRVTPLVRPQGLSAPSLGDDIFRDMEEQMRQWQDFMKKNMMDMSLLDDMDPSRLAAPTRRGNVLQAAPMTSSSLFNFNISDRNGSIRLVRNNNKTTVTATDPSGKVIFSGPYDTEAEKAAVPSEVRARLENVSFMDN